MSGSSGSSARTAARAAAATVAGIARGPDRDAERRRTSSCCRSRSSRGRNPGAWARRAHSAARRARRPRPSSRHAGRVARVPAHALADRIGLARPELSSQLFVDDDWPEAAGLPSLGAKKRPRTSEIPIVCEVSRRREPREHHRVRVVPRRRRRTLGTQERAPVTAERQTGDDARALDARGRAQPLDERRVESLLRDAVRVFRAGERRSGTSSRRRDESPGRCAGGSRTRARAARCRRAARARARSR